MIDCFTWVEASLQQLKAQTGLVQVPRAQLEGHPVAEAGVALTLHHTAALRLHHLSVNLQAHLDTHTCREHTCCVTAAGARGGTVQQSQTCVWERLQASGPQNHHREAL